MTSENEHISVLLHESIELLNPKKGGIVVDGTLGNGGHARLLRDRVGETGRLIGIDADSDAIRRAQGVLGTPGARTDLVCENFRNIDKVLASLGVAEVDAIMLDLGLSSPQIESSGRGFSFLRDEPLVMTLSKDAGEGAVNAREIVNTWAEETLADIIYGFGEERFARRIAARIVEVRSQKPIERTVELVEIVRSATPAWYHHRKTHYATKTFQAIRIAANDEMRALEEAVTKGFERLAPNGKMAVISFHSLEDRFVKNFFKQKAKENIAILVTKKAVVPTREEALSNRRARSAKLRVIEKL